MHKLERLPETFSAHVQRLEMSTDDHTNRPATIEEIGKVPDLDSFSLKVPVFDHKLCCQYDPELLSFVDKFVDPPANSPELDFLCEGILGVVWSLPENAPSSMTTYERKNMHTI